jgi:hypothetical protein
VNPNAVSTQLQRIASSAHFVADCYVVTDEWTAAGAGPEVIDPILRFMEQHPSVDFGTPGPLVHFVEQFLRKGYEEQLHASILRKPTQHTAWMLNRLITGAATPDEKAKWIRVMEGARVHPLADAGTVATMERFLMSHGE